jgi:hypothetical protein
MIADDERMGAAWPPAGAYATLWNHLPAGR